MRTIVSTLVVLLLVIAVTGCTDQNKGGGSNSDGQVTTVMKEKQVVLNVPGMS